jgi:hypothetical protein
LFGQENASLRGQEYTSIALTSPYLRWRLSRLIRRAMAVSFFEMRGPLPPRQKRFINNKTARN